MHLLFLRSIGRIVYLYAKINSGQSYAPAIMYVLTMHCPYKGLHITFYTAYAANSILYGP